MQELDENGDGELQLQEIVELFRRVRLEGGGGSACGEEDQRFQAIEDHLKSTFAGADTDGSQGISPSEFLKVVCLPLCVSCPGSGSVMRCWSLLVSAPAKDSRTKWGVWGAGVCVLRN